MKLTQDPGKIRPGMYLCVHDCDYYKVLSIKRNAGEWTFAVSAHGKKRNLWALHRESISTTDLRHVSQLEGMINVGY